MYVSVENITQKNHLIKLGNLPTGSAFLVNDKLYVKPSFTLSLHPEYLTPVINIQDMFISYWKKDTYVQPVRIRKAEIKYDDLYGEDA